MIILFLITIIAIIPCIYIYKDKRYKETTYYQITKNSYWSMNKGTHGEYLLYTSLRYLEDTGGKLLFNVYIPKTNNQTTEIDAILISHKGLFVFESKNYSGWIFGNEMHRNWTQTLPKGWGESHKERFYNPIKQNLSHITHLKRLIGDKFPLWSIIVFSDNCSLKNITTQSKNVYVINRYNISSVINKIYSTKLNTLTNTDINNIYNQLLPYTQVCQSTKELHISSITNISP